MKWCCTFAGFHDQRKTGVDAISGLLVLLCWCHLCGSRFYYWSWSSVRLIAPAWFVSEKNLLGNSRDFLVMWGWSYAKIPSHMICVSHDVTHPTYQPRCRRALCMEQPSLDLPDTFYKERQQPIVVHTTSDIYPDWKGKLALKAVPKQFCFLRTVGFFSSTLRFAYDYFILSG